MLLLWNARGADSREGRYFRELGRTLSIVLLLTFAVCGMHQPPQKKLPMEKIYVDSLSVLEPEKAGKPLRIQVKGYLPNPAYVFDHFQVEVVADTVRITPWAQYDPDKIVIQITIPFEKICTVKKLKSGKYRIEAIGRDKRVAAFAVVRK